MKCISVIFAKSSPILWHFLNNNQVVQLHQQRFVCQRYSKYGMGTTYIQQLKQNQRMKPKKRKYTIMQEYEKKKQMQKTIITTRHYAQQTKQTARKKFINIVERKNCIIIL